MPNRAKRFYLCNLIPLWEIDEKGLAVDWPVHRAGFGERVALRADLSSRPIRWADSSHSEVDPELKVRFEVYESDFLLSGGPNDRMAVLSSHADFGESAEVRPLKIVQSFDAIPEAEREQSLFLRDAGPEALEVRGFWKVADEPGGDVSGDPEYFYDVYVEGRLQSGEALSLHERSDHELEAFDRDALLFLPEQASADYEEYVPPPRQGKVTPLLNSRSWNGPGPSVDIGEAFAAMEKLVESLAPGDSVQLSNWLFRPDTPLIAGAFAGRKSWGELFADRAAKGIAVRLLLNDFDPIAPFRAELDASLAALNTLIDGLPEAARANLEYVVSLHPAEVGWLKGALGSLFSQVPARAIRVGAHHQKFMVVRKGEQTTAFCGGLDLHPRRPPVAWNENGPWRDIHLRLEGPIALDLAREFAERWNREKESSTRAPRPGWKAFESLPVPQPTSADRTPERLAHKVQMLRTVSAGATLSAYSTKRDDIRRIYHQAVRAATSYLYFENQYFRSVGLAEAVAEALRERPGLVAIFVVVANAAVDDGDNPMTGHGSHLQHEFFDRIAKSGGQARFYTMQRSYLHSKLLLVDDRWMTAGSANANDRGFELDSELNVAILDPGLVGAFRRRLFAHTLGISAAESAALAPKGFLARWDAVTAANAKRQLEQIPGSDVVAFDYRQYPGRKNLFIPDSFVHLDTFGDDPRLAVGEAPASPGAA